MMHKCAAIAGFLLAAALIVPACGDSDFPTRPAPLASSPVTVQQGDTYQGNVVQGDESTSFNMTLIARGVAAQASSAGTGASVLVGRGGTSAASSGQVEITGNFETGRGLRGAVQGTLEGSLADGKFVGSLTADTGACAEERRYSGRVTAAGIAWVPGERLRTCPSNELTFAIQIGTPRGSACTYDVSFADVSFSGNGGTGTVIVSAPSGCPWLAETPAPWVTFEEPATFVGGGTVAFKVQPNPQTEDRQVSLRIAGATVPVEQGPVCRYSLSAAAASFGGAGGRGTVGVEAPARCEWQAAESVDWIAVSPTEGRANGTVTLTIAANAGPARQASVQIAGSTFTVLQGATAPQCSYAIAPSRVVLESTGGSGTVAVTAPPGCAWTAETSVPWLTILGSSSGVGSGAVSYSVQPLTGASRTGTAQIAGQVFTVAQTSLDCTYTITPSEVKLDGKGGPGTVAITAPAGCAWSAETSVDWLTILGSPAGNGPGTVSYSVQPNTGAQRTGTAKIAGQTFTVTQSAVECTFTIAPTSALLPQSGGTGSVGITTQNGCVWTAQPLVNWIVITNVSAGAGKDSVTYSVTANFGATRTGTLRVAGQIATVTQEGCTYVVDPNTFLIQDGAATTRRVTVTSPVGCAWKVSESADWIDIRDVLGASGGTGGFTLGISQLPAATDRREATVSVMGATTATVTVTQTHRPIVPPR